MRRVHFMGPFLLLILGASGLLAAIWLGRPWGFIGYLFGPGIGAALMLALLSAVTVTGIAVQNLLYRGIPWLPVCRNGCCRGGRLSDLRDYQVVWNSDWTVRGFRCRCGITHQKIGRRFVEIAEDGSIKHYLIWKPFKGWWPDQGSPRNLAPGLDEHHGTEKPDINEKEPDVHSHQSSARVGRTPPG